MTTVGYGDELPTTTASNVLALMVMLVGIGFVAILTGAVAERFVKPSLEAEEEEVEEKLGTEGILKELRALRAQVDGLQAAVREQRPP